MADPTFAQLEDDAFAAVEEIIAVNRDVYVAQVKLELAREYDNPDQVAALQDKLIELLQRNRQSMFALLDAVVCIGEQGKRSRRFMELYRDLLEQVKDPNNVSLYSTDPEELDCP